STDNGQTFQQLTGNANCTVAVTATGTLNGEQLFSTEMLQLDLSGGTLPPQLRIRESPTRHSYGETRMSQSPDGYEISSFFDVFTELSTDGGNTWLQATNPGHMELHIDPGTPPTTLLQPTQQGSNITLSVLTQPGLRYAIQ